MPEKIIRDPVHDVIAFRLERPVDALLFKLLNAGEFQRLRRIHQLGMASLAYPGADHSRYSHSLGVMETARKIIDQLRQSFAIDEEGETICLAGKSCRSCTIWGTGRSAMCSSGLARHLHHRTHWLPVPRGDGPG